MLKNPNSINWQKMQLKFEKRAVGSADNQFIARTQNMVSSIVIEILKAYHEELYGVQETPQNYQEDDLTDS